MAPFPVEPFLVYLLLTPSPGNLAMWGFWWGLLWLRNEVRAPPLSL